MRRLTMLCCGVALLCGHMAWADIYSTGFLDSGGSFTNISAPGDLYGTYAFGINDSGQIAGAYLASNEANGIVSGGFLETGGSYTTVGPAPTSPSGSSTALRGINDSGQILAVNSGEFFGIESTLISGSKSTLVQIGVDAVLSGINNLGQAVGTYIGADRLDHGFLYSGGVFTTLDAPGFAQTSLLGINDSGQITGIVSGSNDSGGVDIPLGVFNLNGQGVLYSGGVFTPISDPSALGGASGTLPWGINDSGQIVGGYNGADGQQAFLDTGGVFTNVDVAAPAGFFVNNSFAYGINNSGQIVGTFTTESETPEPGIFPVLVLCVSGLLVMAYRRKLAVGQK